MLFTLLLSLSALAQEDAPPTECQDPSILVGQAEREVENFFLAEATKAIEATEEAWACSQTADPHHLGRLWQAQGMVYLLQGDQEAAVHAFAASRRVVGDTWNDNFGPQGKALFLEASEEGEGRLEVKGLGVDQGVAVDGAPFEPPAPFGVGLHLVQVLGGDQRALHAGVVDVPLDEEVTLSVETFDADIAENMAYIKHPHSSRGLLAAGASAALLSGAGFVVASMADDKFMGTSDRDEATSWLNVNHATTIAGGMFGATATGLALGAVIQGRW